MVYNGFNLLSNKQLHLWLDHQKLRKQDIGDAETDVPLSKENLLFLNKDHKFTKSMFPDVFKRSVPQESQENGIARYKAKIEWTRIWLQQRQDKDDFAIETDSKHLPIHCAFNKLSNRQLQLWLDGCMDWWT